MATSVNHYQLIDGTKSIPLNALPEEAWTHIRGGDVGDTEDLRQLYATVAFMYRCVDVRANALMGVPWDIYSLNADDPAWSHDDESPPDELNYLANLPTLLWLIESSLTLKSEAALVKDMQRRKLLDVRYMQPGSYKPVWDKQQGLVGFKRKIGKTEIELPTNEVVYVWRPNPFHETKPNTSPAEAAMLDAGVLYDAGMFAQLFFKRGAIKATLLTVPRETQKDQRDELKRWWQRFFGGIQKAHETNVISADVKPVVIGEGMAELSDKELSTEKRENIATAMGVPHSMVLSNAANYATAHEDKLNFYEQTIIPELRLISRALNQQLLTPLGYKLQFNPQEMAVFQEDEKERSQSYAQYVGAGMKPSIAAQVLGIDLPEGVEYEDLDTEPETAEPQPPPVMVAPVAPEPDAERETEMRRFRSWAKKRIEKPNFDPAQFESDTLTDADKATVLDELEDAGAAMRPFPSIWTGKAIPDAKASALAFKQMILQLDPDDDEGERRLRDRLERRNLNEIADAMRNTFDGMQGDFVMFDDPNEAARNIQNAYRSHNGAVHDAIRRTVTRSADFGVGMAMAQMDTVNLAFDWDMPLIEARDWANQYSFGLIQGIDETTLARLQRDVATWFETSEGLDALIDDLTPIFGRDRAELIAATETTRAAAEGQMLGYRNSGVVEQVEWRTTVDERVCPICGPMDSRRAPLSDPQIEGVGIPAHPRCRCWWVPVID